ncbi:MAG: DUF885 domain-containing protein [Emcibacter sp.]|nr:DUF885 domain-containing protein [Emcibacter sp.]
MTYAISLKNHYNIIIISIILLSFALIGQRVFAGSAEDFHKILTDHWAHASQEKVFYRTDPDGFRMNGSLPDFSKTARDRRTAFNQEILNRLKKIDEKSLNKEDRISFKIFKYERLSEADGTTRLSYLFPIASLYGYHIYFADAPANMSFLKSEDYKNYLISLADFPRYNQDFILILKDAITKGYTQYCKSMEGYEDTISQYVVKDAQDSALFLPFTNFPAQMSPSERQKFTEQGKKLITEKIIPEYQALYNFFTKEYQPNCRKDVGVTSLKNGAEYYQSQIKFFTTTDMKPKEIHELGLSEVKRIRSEMNDIIVKVGFKGSFKEFLNSLRNDPKFYAETEHELLANAALLAKDAEGELPKFFGLLPRNTYKIKGGHRGVFYMPSSGDGTTSGTYFLDTEDLSAQTLYTLEALTYHEGVPGHHLQTALAMELDMPEFRKTLNHSAYTEGWGLYSERLGLDMGFYQDPYSDFGRLTNEAFRACRLVVDTGMHAFSWSREKAIAFMLDNTALSKQEVEREIDRYITWPAQALSYKIGELKIRELRTRAETELGEKFDLRTFHDIVLGSGSAPIAILEEIINDWILNQK